MRVFWPTDLPRSDVRGVVVGWRNSALDVFVLAILDEVEVRRADPWAFLECLLTQIDSLEMSKRPSK